MREQDGDIHPAALARERRNRAQVVAGFVIAAAGLAAVFMLEEVYLGFGVALVGAGIVPFDKLANVFRRGG